MALRVAAAQGVLFAGVVMQVAFRCPSCDRSSHVDCPPGAEALHCSQCEWSRSIDLPAGEPPAHCVACGCDDLWRQKHFPQRIGVTIVALGAILSTIAWAYVRPVLALGILMGFGLLDLVMYMFMKDVLVCYRCGARHADAELPADYPQFDLEVAERYRQEARRLQEATQAKS